MEKSFVMQFAESRGAPIQFGALVLTPSFRLPVTDAQTFVFSMIRYSNEPVQGLRIRAVGCELEIANQTGKQFVLWTDTAPRSSEVRLVKRKSRASLVLMNVWREERYGGTQQGMNFAAMSAQPHEDGSILLRCSDGGGEADFNDLVVHIVRATGKRTGVLVAQSEDRA